MEPFISPGVSLGLGVLHARVEALPDAQPSRNGVTLEDCGPGRQCRRLSLMPPRFVVAIRCK